MTAPLVNQGREKNYEKRSQPLKSEKEALLIGKGARLCFRWQHCRVLVLGQACEKHFFISDVELNKTVIAHGFIEYHRKRRLSQKVRN